MLFQKAFAAATTGNAIEGEPYVVNARHRVLKRFGFVGSAAVADAKVAIYSGMNLVGEFYNTTAGASKVPVDTDMISCGDAFIKGGDTLNVKIVTSPNAQQGVISLELEDYVRKGPKRAAAKWTPYRKKW